MARCVVNMRALDGTIALAAEQLLIDLTATHWAAAAEANVFISLIANIIIAGQKLHSNERATRSATRLAN